MFLALVYELDLWNEEDWYDPRDAPELALRRFKYRALCACEGLDSADEAELVTELLQFVNNIVEGWASSRADDAAGGFRDVATVALANEDSLRRLLAHMKRQGSERFRRMTEEEFAAELRNMVRDSPQMRPRSLDEVAALMRVADGWRSAREATLSASIIADWVRKAAPSK